MTLLHERSILHLLRHRNAARWLKIEIKEKSKSLQGFKNIVEANAGVVTPAWMESDVETLTGTVKELPLREQIDVPVNDTLIVELYSK